MMNTIFKNKKGDRLVETDEGLFFLTNRKRDKRSTIYNFAKNPKMYNALKRYYGWPIPTKIKYMKGGQIK